MRAIYRTEEGSGRDLHDNVEPKPFQIFSCAAMARVGLGLKNRGGRERIDRWGQVPEKERESWRARLRAC